MSFRKTIFLHFLLFFTLTYAKRRACRPGTFLTGRKCSPCPPGTYQPSRNALKCISCPRGTYNPRRGSRAIEDCIECPAGTFQPNVGAGSLAECKSCPSDQNAPQGAPSCISCPGGFSIELCVSQGDDFTVPNRGTCQGCNVFKVGPAQCFDLGPTNPICIECPISKTSSPNDLECTICPQGTMRKPGGSTCEWLLEQKERFCS